MLPATCNIVSTQVRISSCFNKSLCDTKRY